MTATCRFLLDGDSLSCRLIELKKKEGVGVLNPDSSWWREEPGDADLCKGIEICFFVKPIGI